MVQRFDVRPVGGRSLLSLVIEGSLGTGPLYVVVQLSTMLLLSLAANTSFGGLPVLAAKLSADGYLPHLFGLRADRLVHRYGVGVLAVVAAILLVASRGQVDDLVPLFAVGVFVGFFLCQVGMVRHWRAERSRGWRWRATVNGTGAVLTAIAALVIAITKFPHGAWLIVAMIPLLVWLFTRVDAASRRIGDQLGVGSLPAPPRKLDTVVVVPVVAISRLTSEVLSIALGMGHTVVAVRVTYPDETTAARQMEADWTRWRSDVGLVMLGSPHRELGRPLCDYVRGLSAQRVIVLIGEVQPARLWERLLRNWRGDIVARRLSRNTTAVVCRYRMPLADVSTVDTPHSRHPDRISLLSDGAT